MSNQNGNEYDVIVIGSGIGGLACASFLSVFGGKKVLVLEQNETPGGCMQTVTDPVTGDADGETGTEDLGWTWNYGIQYLAFLSTWLGPLRVRETDFINKLTDNKVELVDLDLEFLRLKLPDFEDREYSLLSDLDEFREYLHRKFPNDKCDIDEYWSHLELVDNNLFWVILPKVLPHPLGRILFPVLMQKLEPLMNRTFQDAISEIQNPEIRLILSSYWNFMGMGLDTNLLFWSISQNQQMHGIQVPKGGAKALVDGLIGAIQKRGGDIRTGVYGTVSEIILEGLLCKKATGVKLVDGTEIKARTVVSAAGLPQTIGKLVPAKAFPSRVSRSIDPDRHVSLPSNLILRVGFDKEVDYKFMSKLIDKAVYRKIHNKSWEMDDDPTALDWKPLDVMFFFPKYYFSDKKSKMPQTVEIASITDFRRYFSKYKSYDDPEYQKMEKRVSEKLLDELGEWFPELRAHVAHHWLSSPLTIYERIRHQGAAIYGMDSYKILDTDIQSRSGIKNLYLTGEDTFAQGVTTCCGLTTAMVILVDELLSLKTLGKLPGMIRTLFTPWNKLWNLPERYR
ncbi:MAG: NAD(P)/FAD-dependent oxidoreductase [Deltaproteobacteria bacterium]|nr:NAD(P)/FAD-dependent oxidoreductase [Deltaproteobacteria bacterium]